MDYTVCSRETERDYTWDNTHASPSVAEYARGHFAPAFEGSLTTSRFAALLRCSGSPQGVMLCVSVSTPRKDFRNRPIRTMAFLRAESADDENLLAAFFAECLRKPDKETLCSEESPLARSVEGIYQTKGLEGFTGFCRSLPQAERHGAEPTGRHEFPRKAATDRQKLAKSLPSLVEGDEPFLAVLTDREPVAVLESLSPLFDHGTVRIFSEEVSEAKELPEKGGPKKKSGGRWRGIPIGWRGRRVLAVAGFFFLVLGLAWLGEFVQTGKEYSAVHENEEDVCVQAVDQGDGQGKDPEAEINARADAPTQPQPSGDSPIAPVVGVPVSSETFETDVLVNDAVKEESPNEELSSPVVTEGPNSSESVPGDATGTTIDQQAGGTAPNPGDTPDVSEEGPPRLPEPGAAETPAGTEDQKPSLPSDGFPSEPVAPAPESSGVGATAACGDPARGGECLDAAAESPGGIRISATRR